MLRAEKLVAKQGPVSTLIVYRDHPLCSLHFVLISCVCVLPANSTHGGLYARSRLALCCARTQRCCVL
jgi:hypothetical protein